MFENDDNIMVSIGDTTDNIIAQKFDKNTYGNSDIFIVQIYIDYRYT